MDIAAKLRKLADEIERGESQPTHCTWRLGELDHTPIYFTGCGRMFAGWNSNRCLCGGEIVGNKP